MYIATRELELKDRFAKPGDKVPEVLDWSYPVLLAHLNMGWIKYVGDGADAHPDDKQSSSSTTTKTDKAPTPAKPVKEKKAVATKESKKQTAPVAVKVKVAPAPEAEESHACSDADCGKTFKTTRALKIHVTTAHKK